MAAPMNRRDVVQLLVTSLAAGPLLLEAAETGKPLFFTKDEFELLDCLTDMIIPRDDHSGGARDAGVAAYIDRTVAEAFLPEDKESWRKGLAEVNKTALEAVKKPFLKAPKDKQLAIVTKMSKNRHEDKAFFFQLKDTTAFAYYSSKIGIHDEMGYLGNVLLDKFAGFDAV